jgi:hypothetical protein
VLFEKKREWKEKKCHFLNEKKQKKKDLSLVKSRSLNHLKKSTYSFVNKKKRLKIVAALS